MRTRAHNRLCMMIELCVAAHSGTAVGCGAYADGIGLAPAADAAAPRATGPSEPSLRGSFAVDAGDRAAPLPSAADASSTARRALPDTDRPAIDPADKSVYANLRVARSAQYAGYLTDGFGRALYMLSDDTPGDASSACLDACARDWPPFDLQVVHPSPELEPNTVGRFHRQDGLWQTTYRGHALYYRATELDEHAVTGDGIDGRWFVARDYLLFVARAQTFAPAGASSGDRHYLTTGYGRTLYVCLDDEPGTAAAPAISSCDADCLRERPILVAADTASTTALPSLLDPVALRELVRPDGRRQLTYRGWPLYLFQGDSRAGAANGHNDRAWRAIDPVQFGEPAP